jgi:hypothetical protein
VSWAWANAHALERFRGSRRDLVRLIEGDFICFALTKDLVNDARDGRRGVDHNSVPGNVFFRPMQSQNVFPFRLSSAPLVFRSLVKPPLQCVKVDFKDENAVEQVNEA